MDLTVMLRDADARGALFYILNYSTKTEQTLDVLLNLLAPVVERIRAENVDTPATETAVRLIRLCLSKSVSNQAIGAPAAARKVLGRDDHKISHVATNCPMAPLLAWTASEVEKRSVACPSRDRDNGNSGTDGDDDESNNDDGNTDNDEEDIDNNDGITIAAVGGNVKISTRAHHLYLVCSTLQPTRHTPPLVQHVIRCLAQTYPRRRGRGGLSLIHI